MNNKMCDDYNEYLNGHIGNTEKAFNWMLENLPELFDEFDSDYLGAQISMHDVSKYSDEEYDAYCEYFYGKSKTEDVKMNFDYAWLHHIHHNPHHWQYWLLQEDDGDIKALEMPKEYVLEMISDWWSFSWKSNNLYEIFDWYADHKNRMHLNEATKNLVEDILDKIKNKLDEDINEQE